MTMIAPELRWAFDLVDQRKDLSSVWIETRSANDGDDTTLFVASTDDEDRAMDVVKQNWRLASFRANPVILDNHDHRTVVGSAVDATVPKAGDDAGKLMIRVKWHLGSSDPKVRNVGEQHLAGVRRAGSVGFKAGKRTERHKLPKDSPYFREPVKIETWWGGEIEQSGFLFESPELFEFSSATVPMNAAAIQRALTGRAVEDDDTEPEDDTWAWLDDEAAVGKVADALFPILMARAKAAFFPEPDEEAPAEEAPAEMAWRRLVVPRLRPFVRTDTDLRRILRAVLDTGPPAPTLRGDGLDFLFPRS